MTATHFTGKPCRNGHIAPRYVSDNRCIECKAEKTRRHYAKHAEARRAKSSAYYFANHDAGKAVRRQYFMDNREAGLAARKENWVQNREKYLARKRAKAATPEHKAARAAKRKEQAHIYRTYEQKRRAAEARAVPQWYGELDEFVMREASQLCDLRAVATGVQWQIDHLVPLLSRKACGLHCAANLQVIPRTLNAQKNNKMVLTEPLEWLQRL